MEVNTHMKPLKISAKQYHPPSKVDSSMSLNSYHSVPVSANENEDLKLLSKSKYIKEKDRILKMSRDELCEVIVDSNGK